MSERRFLSKFRQTLPVLLVLAAVFLSGCHRFSQNAQVTPPATHPLARHYIGFGVINSPFAHLLSEPGPGGVSEGHLRRGTVVRIIERRQVVNQGNAQLWVLAEGNYQPSAAPSRGWLQEAAVEIFDRESRAVTASRAMGP